MWRRGVRAFSSATTSTNTLEAATHNVKLHGPFIGSFSKKKYSDILKARRSGLASFKPDPNRPKRPSTPYLQFAAQFTSGEEGINVAERMTDAATRWNSIPEEEKAAYIKKFEAERTDYEQKLKEYETSDQHLDYLERVVEAARSLRYPDDSRKPKRYPSSYQLFSSSIQTDEGERAVVRMQRAAKLWAELPEEAREKFIMQADNLRKKYHQDLAKYHTSAEYQDYCDLRAEWNRKRDKFVRKIVSTLKGLKVFGYLSEQGVPRKELDDVGLSLADLGSVDSEDIRSTVQKIIADQQAKQKEQQQSVSPSENDASP